jgi:hypothetical protein
VQHAVGQVVRWSRQHGGLPVAGNGRADHVAVLVGADGIVSWSRYWPEPGPRLGTGSTLLDSAQALRRAASSIGARAKGDVRLLSVRPVLGTGGPGSGMLVPAWAYADDTGAAVVVDARTGGYL